MPISQAGIYKDIHLCSSVLIWSCIPLPESEEVADSWKLYSCPMASVYIPGTVSRTQFKGFFTREKKKKKNEGYKQKWEYPAWKHIHLTSPEDPYGRTLTWKVTPWCYVLYQCPGRICRIIMMNLINTCGMQVCGFQQEIQGSFSVTVILTFWQHPKLRTMEKEWKQDVFFFEKTEI